MSLLNSDPLPSTQPLSNAARLNMPGVLSQAALTADESATTRHIAFVDAGLSDLDTLVAGFENTQIVLIESGQDGVAQMTAALSRYNNLSSVQIYAHGRDGLLQLGDTLLSHHNVERYSEQLQQWASALSLEADLLIYSCNLVAGTSGLSLVERLGELTGADVAASDDLTGAGGDWDLEVSTGAIEQTTALNTNTQASYSGALSLLNNGDFEQGLTGWQSLRSTAMITTDAISGSSALEITGTSRGVKQTVGATAGETYSLTGSGKTTSSGNTTVGITFYDASGARLAGRSQKVRGSDWDDFSIERVAPDGTASIRVWAYKADESGSFFLDNLELNGGTVTPPEPPASGSELLRNGGFESGLNQWSGVRGTERTTGAGVYAGTKALELTSERSGTRQVLDAVAGETYKISGYGRKTSDEYVGFGITFYDANNQKIAGSGVGRSIRSDEWQLYENEAVAPDNARFVRFWTYKKNGNGVGLLDQLSLKAGEATPPPPPTDDSAPTATLNASDLNLEGNASYDFTVTYQDDTGVDVSDLGNGDIRVTGPNGFSQLADFIRVNNNSDGAQRIATYRLQGPGGQWDGDDNGAYSVFLRANQVSDTLGNAASTTVSLGDFRVNLRSNELPIGDINSGVAARDGATGMGYLMHSEELVSVRFLSSPPHPNNSSNLVAVVHQNGQWFYDTNTELVAFTPRSSDRLLAELDFGADTATLLVGTNTQIHGIAAGYASGDLAVTPNIWNGSSNNNFARGEFGITGSQVTLYGTGSQVPGQFTFDSSTISVSENVGSISLTVNRVGGSDGTVSVDYATSDVSATAGQDYSSRSGTLTFADGQTSQTITVPITNDTQGEADEDFVITLNNATNNASIGLGATVVTIRENDGGANGGNTNDLLPDLLPIAQTSSDYTIDTDEIPGRVLLRLSTEVANVGDGPVELWGTPTSADVQPVFQRLYDDQSGFRDVLAGEFVNHPSHGHLHFEGFAEYNLREINTDGSVGDIVASGGKTSFCLININQPFPELTDAAIVADGRGGSSCGLIQGVDVGYSDVYGRYLPDQWIDVTNVNDGTYWLEITADPDNNMIEKDETNNTDYIQVTLDNPNR